jgi:hypothetical protein
LHAPAAGASQRQPLLLAVENLHWIDTETQAVLDCLVDSLPAAHLVLLVNYRPEYQHHWGSKTYYTQLRLDPLPPASAEALLHELLGAHPTLAPLIARLIARTEGNPFFLEESVHTLVETGVLVGERGAYQLAQALPPMQMPMTGQSVLAARMDRLPPDIKCLLHMAAVIGMEVLVPLLQAIAGLPEATVHDGLRQLQAAEFLYETRLVPEHARQLAERALILSRDRKERGVQAWTLRLLGAIALHSHPLDVGLAETHYRQALALAEELGMRPLQAHCHTGLGTLYTQVAGSRPTRHSPRPWHGTVPWR